MKKLTPFLLIALLIWCSVLSVIAYRSNQAANEARQIEEVRQGLSNIANLSFRVPLTMKLAADDVLGPDARVGSFETRFQSLGTGFKGNHQSIGYAFELPENTSNDAIDDILQRFDYYSGLLLGINSSKQWPFELKAGQCTLIINVPEPDREGKRIFLDVSVRYSPYVHDSN